MYSSDLLKNTSLLQSAHEMIVIPFVTTYPYNDFYFFPFYKLIIKSLKVLFYVFISCSNLPPYNIRSCQPQKTLTVIHF